MLSNYAEPTLWSGNPGAGILESPLREGAGLIKVKMKQKVGFHKIELEEKTSGRSKDLDAMAIYCLPSTA